MTLYHDFLEWQTRLNELLEEAEALAARIAELEQQNLSLQQRLLEQENGGGFNALSGIYDDGFHICPPYFGQHREDDCLFCLNFLHHKGRKE